MSEAPLNNAPEARTPEGTLIDQSTPPTPQTPDPKATPTPEAKTPTPPTTAPEKYADFKLPDGVTLEGEGLTKATELFKSLNLTQEQAQSLVDYHAGQIKALSEGLTSQMEATHNEWKTELEADAEIAKIGGQKIRETLGRALDSLGDAKLAADFKNIMNLTGVGDNLAFVKVVHKLASLVAEPGHVAGGAPAPSGQNPSGTSQRPSAAKSMYPNLPG